MMDATQAEDVAMPPHRVQEGQTLSLPCDCGAHQWPAVVGESQGFADVREVVVDLGNGETEICRVAFFPNGETLWIDYPEEDDEESFRD